MDPASKVLIVEDDVALAQMCAKLVRRRGHTAMVASTGHEALAMVQEEGGVDVVISDVQMPQMSGIQLIGRLRALDPTIPVILITGYAQLLSSASAVAVGAADYIMKPFEAETLIGSLERAIKSKLTSNSAHG